MLKGDPLRTANLRHVLSMIYEAGYGDRVVLAQQVGGKARSSNDLRLECCPTADVLTYDCEDDLIHKSRLVNLATEHLRERGYDYAFMIDGDIHLDVPRTLEHLDSLDPKEVPVVKPFRFFIRLNIPDSAKVRAGERVVVRKDDYPPKEIVGYPGAGAWAYSMAAFDRVGGMDESYTGWGWEDTDFSQRLREVLPYRVLPFVGYHLEHENDRVINQDNFNMFAEEHAKSNARKVGWERMSVHVTKKVCIFSYGRCGSTMLATGLARHPDVDMFEAEGDDLAYKGCTEPFATEHFKELFPDTWSATNIVKYLGEHLTFGEKGLAGFKLMCGQPNERDFPHLFSYIKHPQNNFYHIHVYRRSLFDQLCSFFVAEASKHWVKPYGDFETEIDPERFVARAEANLIFAERIIGKCPKALHVAYEDLVSDWHGTMLGVQKHLALAPKELSVETKPQREAGAGWGKHVKNFGEIRDAFRGHEPVLRESFPSYWGLIAETSKFS